MADKNMEAQISVEFEEATSRQSLNSGETINTLWGKVKRWLSDLKAVAFSGSYIDLSDKPTTATTDTDGLMSAEDKTKLDDADNTYALKSKYGDTTIDVGRKEGTYAGICSTAEGQDTTASDACSHAEGSVTVASGVCSHAEGVGTVASGVYSHSEGDGTTASGVRSHAGGGSSVASGDSSFAHGKNTQALHDHEVALGKYNKSSSDTLFSVGDGTSESARHNAFEISTTGGKLHDKDIATTDLIPSSLPANGGNADSVNGLHASDFMPYLGVVDDLFAVDKSCICAYGQDTLNTPLKAGLTLSGGGLCFVNLTNGAEWANYIVMPSGDEHLYSATSKNGVLSSEWRRINDRNADTVGGFKIKVTHIAGSTDQYGNLLLWTVVDNKKPFLVIINGYYAIPFQTADLNHFYFYASVINCATHSSVSNTSVSADVYYIE